MYRHTHAAFMPLSHSPPENMSFLLIQVQEKNRHSRSQIGFRKHYLRMTWGKNDVVRHECTERQRVRKASRVM